MGSSFDLVLFNGSPVDSMAGLTVLWCLRRLALYEGTAQTTAEQIESKFLMKRIDTAQRTNSTFKGKLCLLQSTSERRNNTFLSLQLQTTPRTINWT